MHTDGEVEGETFFLCSTTCRDVDGYHEIKQSLLLRRKTMKRLGKILNCKYSTPTTNEHIVKAMVFPVETAMTTGPSKRLIKKSDAFKL